MAHTGELQQVVEHLRSATDRVAEMRRLVLESGGAWPDHKHDVVGLRSMSVLGAFQNSPKT